MERTKLSPEHSKRYFRNNANSVHWMNYAKDPMRGGIRL